MGREAQCKCEFGGSVADVKIHLEPGLLTLRGGFKNKLPTAELKNIKVVDDQLTFKVAGKSMRLHLGKAEAEKWAIALVTPPPSPARKLGITDKTIVRTVGPVLDDALLPALDEAARVSANGANLILACVETPEDLADALKAAKTQLENGVPIWMVYRKGPGHALTETWIRTELRSAGYMDTKVASVSAKRTALRFNLRKSL
jgi:hypothetical protein